MSFLDKAKGAAVKKAGEKAKEGHRRGQTSSTRAKTKEGAGDLKEELGEIVFLQRTGGAPADAEAQITRRRRDHRPPPPSSRPDRLERREGRSGDDEVVGQRLVTLDGARTQLWGLDTLAGDDGTSRRRRPST